MTQKTDADKKLIQRHFDDRASVYESSAILQREVGQHMLSRLDYVTLQPTVVLDVGCGTGRSVQALLQRYRSASVLALDVSAGMLQQTRKHFGWWRKPGLICGDAESLPIADNSVDLIHSNLMLQWCEPQRVFAEFLRVLRPQGLLMFSTFGPDTLMELRTSWAQVDQQAHVNHFIDMHLLGDHLLQAGFANPVMDMDMMRLTYQTAREVMQDLKAIGANTIRQRAHKGLVTKNKMNRVYAAYESYRREGVLPASFEVVYGHAWKAERQRQPKQSGEIRIPIDQLGRIRTE